MIDHFSEETIFDHMHNGTVFYKCLLDMTAQPLCETIIIKDGFVFKEFYLLLKTDSYSVSFCKKIPFLMRPSFMTEELTDLFPSLLVLRHCPVS